MSDIVLKVGDRVKITAVYHTDSLRQIVDGKTGTVEEISHYNPIASHKVRYDEPYLVQEYKEDYDYYSAKELVRI